MARSIGNTLHFARQRTLTLLVAWVFLLYALIPMGYMPASKQGQTTLSLSMCVSGLSAATVRVLKLDGDHAVPDHQASYCAFASALGHDGPPVSPMAYLPLALFSGLLLPTFNHVDIPVWKVGGPPLGARAPPVYR